jgi:type II secretory pathway component PulK
MMRNDGLRPARRGASLLSAMIVLIILSFVTSAVIGLIGTRRGRDEDRSRRAQARWLAEGGAERASAKLAADPAYGGETWDVPAEALDGRHAAEVRIAVAPAAAGARRVTVTARYPKDAPVFASYERTWTMTTGKERGAP